MWVELILLGILIVLLLVLGLYLRFRTLPPLDTGTFIDEYSNISSWSRPMQEGLCHTYTFEGSFSEGIFQPANPTLDNLTAATESTDLGCRDADQLIAGTFSRTCTDAPNTVSNCVGVDGRLYQPGETEVFSSTCPSPSCLGALALVAIPYSGTNSRCIQITSTDGSIESVPCNPTIDDQVFRVISTFPGQSPRAGQNNGFLLQISDRTSSNCLNADITSKEVSFGSCAEGVNGGFNWILVPGGRFPTQLVYVGNIDIAKVIQSSSDIERLLTSGTFYSLEFENNDVLLATFSTNVNDTNQTSIYIPYLAFNEFINASVS